jgi:hypothetical protein
LNHQLQERARCRESVAYFASNYVKIQDRAKLQTVQWQPWDYLLDVFRQFSEHKEIIIGKARQLGLTWAVCIFADWLAIFHDNVKVLFLSQGEEEAWDMISKCRFIITHLPDFLRPSIGHDTKSLMDFPSLDSELKALPSTDKAGRSTDATLVIRDELEQHPEAERNFLAIGPTIDAGEAKLIEISTRGEDKNSHFFRRFTQALEGKNNAHPIFLGWKLRPVRREGMTLEEWWEKQIVPKYTELQREREYPATLDEFLRESQVLSFFDFQGLRNLELDTRPTIPRPDEFEKYNTVHFYKLPVPGRKYVVFTDPSGGKEDPHATVVLDAITCERVAGSYGMIPADVVAQIHHELVMYFNRAYNAFEANAYAGGIFLTIVMQLATPNMYKRSTGEWGWWSGRETRRGILYPLQTAVRNNLISEHDREWIQEFREFIQPQGKEPQAPKSGHDDRVIAWAGAYWLRETMPRHGLEVTSFAYKESR